MKFSKNEKRLLYILLIALALSTGILLTSAFYPGSHSLYLNRSVLTQPTAAAEFCVKCHIEKVNNISLSVHRNAGCICHGYNPSFTETYNINLAHNLTKNIYCTNCHSSYNVMTGNIDIHSGVSGLNQSAHYILAAGDSAGAYQRARQFFANGTQG
ncbi:MAG: hypothetical protein O8C59_04780 [Candidatus Methanoperedens sp.]|nr:hypothetical protein [Candidatus Methanoperedens sp.]